MSAVIPLARLEPTAIRTAWPDEARNFTPWLAENLDLLGQAVGLELELEGTEVAVGPFSADILAREAIENRLILIENQCAQTDHRHLGQILTYTAGIEAPIAIWVVESFREEHRAAIDFLNRVTSDEFAFFGVEVRLFRVGDNYVPQFDVIAKPNNWSRGASEGRRVAEGNPKALAWQAYWLEILEGLATTMPEVRARKPGRAGWQSIERLATFDDCSVLLWAQLLASGKLKAYVDFDGAGAKRLFFETKTLLSERQEIRGLPVAWHSREDQKRAHASVTMPGIQSRTDESQRAGQIAWLASALVGLRETFGPALARLQEIQASDTDAAKEE